MKPSSRVTGAPLLSSVFSHGSQRYEKYEDSLKRVAYSEAAIACRADLASIMLQPSQRDYGHIRDSEISMPQCNEHHLVYQGKVLLPQHPIRIRYLPHSGRRLLIYGVRGSQEMTPADATATGVNEPYRLESIAWQHKMCDCVEAPDLTMYAVIRDSEIDQLVRFDELMKPTKTLEMGPTGCISSLAISHNGSYLYAIDEAHDCVLRICTSEFNRRHIEQYATLWRPFDCCISQPISLLDGSTTQFLFVSNIDAGVVVFNTETMTIETQFGNDFSPGAKYLTYDPNVGVLFVSSSFDRHLRCYSFDSRSRPGQQKLRPRLSIIDDFMVAKRKLSLRTGGPQCVMWDATMQQLLVLSWSQMKGRFIVKVFRINLHNASKFSRKSFDII